MGEVRSEPFQVIIDHQTESGLDLSVAEIVWSDAEHRPDTYAIAIPETKALVTLDRHIAVRPYSISVYNFGIEQAAEALNHYFGEQIAVALLEARQDGIKTLGNISLSETSRLNIASLQASDPDTPESVREIAFDMVIPDNELRHSRLIPRVRGSQPAYYPHRRIRS